MENYHEIIIFLFRAKERTFDQKKSLYDMGFNFSDIKYTVTSRNI